MLTSDYVAEHTDLKVDVNVRLVLRSRRHPANVSLLGWKEASCFPRPSSTPFALPPT